MTLPVQMQQEIEYKRIGYWGVMAMPATIWHDCNLLNCNNKNWDSMFQFMSRGRIPNRSVLYHLTSFLNIEITYA